MVDFTLIITNNIYLTGQEDIQVYESGYDGEIAIACDCGNKIDYI